MDTNVYRNDEEMEIDLLELIRVVWEKLWIVVLVTLFFALVSGVYTKFFVTPQYQSTTSFYVVSRETDGTYTSSDLTAATQLTNDYTEIIKSRTVAETVITELALDISATDLIKKISVSTPSSARVVYIRVLDSDPAMAQRIANSVRRVASTRIQEVMNSEAVNIVDTANLPVSKYSPSLSKNVMIAGLLGAVLSIGVIVFLYLINDTIKSEDDVEKYLQLSTLGSIPAYQTNKKSRKSSRKKK